MDRNMDIGGQESLRGGIKITVEKVKVEGDGVILLTGPSSCGKGEIAKALCKFLSIPHEKHLSMGDILRRTIKKSKEEVPFRKRLAQDYGIGYDISIFDPHRNSPDMIAKAMEYKQEAEAYLRRHEGFVSQLDWLEFCVAKGLLVPDQWTIMILDALLENSPEFRQGIFILDGYPRTKTAAQYMLSTLNKMGIPVIRVLHLSITKEQMKIRAHARNRDDDTEDSLERRYQFYIDKVQPCIDYLKMVLGPSRVSLIDAHQSVYYKNGEINKNDSIVQVIQSAMEALGLPRYLQDIK